MIVYCMLCGDSGDVQYLYLTASHSHERLMRLPEMFPWLCVKTGCMVALMRRPALCMGK